MNQDDQQPKSPRKQRSKRTGRRHRKSQSLDDADHPFFSEGGQVEQQHLQHGQKKSNSPNRGQRHLRTNSDRRMPDVILNGLPQGDYKDTTYHNELPQSPTSRGIHSYGAIDEMCPLDLKNGDVSKAPENNGDPVTPQRAKKKNVSVQFSPRREFQQLGKHLSSPRSSGDQHPFLQSPRNVEGEEDFFVGRNISKVSPSDSRKKHMRHFSAQLFMRDIKGKPQPKAFRDKTFAILFLMQLAAIVAVAVKYGPAAFLPHDVSATPTPPDKLATIEDDTPLLVDHINLAKLAIVCGIFACALSGLALTLLTVFYENVVQVSLISSIGMSFIWGTVGIGLVQGNFVPVTGMIALAFCIGYSFVVWDRIPFATANLNTALHGVRNRLGVVVLAYAFLCLAMFCNFIWTVAITGVYDVRRNRNVGVDVKKQHDTVNVIIIIAFVVSYFWTLRVLCKIVEVVVAGAIGDWWSSSSAKGNNGSQSSTNERCLPLCFPPAMQPIAYSFGSICYGGLVVGPVQTLRQLFEPFRPSNYDQTLLGFHECLLSVRLWFYSYLDYTVEYINPWAFTYVGMYGYSLLEAGKKATELLQTRGWTSIVTDDLIINTLFLVSLIIGGLTGCVGAIMEDVDQFQLGNTIHHPVLVTFFMTFYIGLLLSNVLLAVASGAVNTVIICYAERPAEFQANHPILCKEMNTAWSEVWPGCLDGGNTNRGGMATQSERDLIFNLTTSGGKSWSDHAGPLQVV